MSQSAFNDEVVSQGFDHQLTLNNESGAATDEIGPLTMSQNGSPTLRQPGPLGGDSFAWAVSPGNHANDTAFVDVGDASGHGFTMGVWFKRAPVLTTPLGATREILVQVGSTTDKGLSVSLDTATSEFAFNRWGVGHLVTGVSITPYLNNQWHLAVASFTVADVLTLLVDGVGVKSYTSPSFIKPTVAGLSIGATDTAAQVFTGELSDAILRNKEGITTAQSLALFESRLIPGDQPPRTHLRRLAGTRWGYPLRTR